MSSDSGSGENCIGWAARDSSGILSPDLVQPQAGDRVGVGTHVNSCEDRQESFCERKSTYTFNDIDADGAVTKGGYSTFIVFNDRYCYRKPDNYSLDLADALLCAGITVYAPMIRHRMNQPGKSLEVIGLGGLDHMAAKFGNTLGLIMTVFSTSISKRDEALTHLDTDNFVVSSDPVQMKAHAKSHDFIVDTASGDHPFDPCMALLKTAGVFILVGFPSEVKFSPASLKIGMKTVAGSITGGTKVTQEMLDFCSEHKIYPMIELIPIRQ